jgi:hypothetical protein
MKINILTIVGALSAMSATVESLSLRGLLGSKGNAADATTAVDGDAAMLVEERILANLAASASAEMNEEGGAARRGLQWISDCGTVAYFHPVYTAGWENGYCALSIGCNAPSFITNAECCNQAYVGQSTGVCNSVAGIPPPTPPTPPPPSPGSPPTPSGVVWYPDYNAQWGVGKCISTLPLPPHGSRPLYSTQLRCCKEAYAGQTSNYCIQNLVNAPTSKPTTPPTFGPTTGPTTSKPTGVPTTSTPTGSPSSKPTTGPTTLTPTGVPSTSTPTGSPSSKPTGGPSATPTSSPSRAPTTLFPTAAPTTRGPTVTQFGSLWYPLYSTSPLVCSNKLPLPVNGAVPYYTTKAECCDRHTWNPTATASCKA